MAHYRTHAQAYFDATQGVDMAPLYAHFTPLLPPGARVLDAGCGSGRDALAFQRMGFAVEAFDASPELAALAQAHTGLPVRVMSFQQMADAMGNAWHARFDGIWACASLLHVPEADQARVWHSLINALKPGGVLYASYKLGEGESTDALGHHFTHATAERVTQWLPAAPLSQVLAVWHSADQRPGVEQAWLNMLTQRMPAHDDIPGSTSGP